MIFFSILYIPDNNALENILISKNNGFVPVVYLNKVDNAFLEQLSSLEVITLGSNQNVGLGVAFYEFENYLEKSGERFYVYFDQDTKTTDSVWKTALEKTEIFKTQKNVGMLYLGNKKKPFSDVVVSSGCVFSSEVIQRVGKHCPSYFVEGVDYDYCLRLKIAGLKVHNIYCTDIDHQSLQDGHVVQFLGRPLSYRIYGSARMRDFNASHFKLIWKSLATGKIRFLLFFIKSLILFNINEYKSRLLQRVSSCS
jgi:rhamnosyltransferase